MAFPWIFHSNLEGGNNSEWDSENDGATPKQLDIAHYSTLAKAAAPSAIPYSGAYCARYILTGQTGDADLEEGDINVANTVNRFFHFNFWFSPDFTATADNTFAVFEAQATSGNAVQSSFGFVITAADNKIVASHGQATPTADSSITIDRGVWYATEIDMTLQTGGTGTNDIYVTREGDLPGAIAAAQVGSLTHVAVTHGHWGVQDHAATTKGTILMDNFIMDDARIYPSPRFQKSPILTKSQHVFIGPGSISGAALITDEASNKMQIWDTDTADVNSTQTMLVEFDIDNQTSIGGPLYFEKGCYVVLSGTDPRGQVFLQTANGHGAGSGPLHHSVANVRRWGKARNI